MTITQLALRPDLRIGDDPAIYQFDLALSGADVATANPTTLIKVAVRDLGQRSLLLPATTATLTPGNPTSGKWSVAFADTTSLLQTPSDLGSAMIKSLLTYADDRIDDVSGVVTGFCKAIFEIQIGAPYQKTTIDALGYIGKGLIP